MIPSILLSVAVVLLLINHSTTSQLLLHILRIQFRSNDDDESMYSFPCTCDCDGVLVHPHHGTAHSGHGLEWGVRLSKVYRMSEGERDENEEYAKQWNI